MQQLLIYIYFITATRNHGHPALHYKEKKRHFLRGWQDQSAVVTFNYM